MPQSVILPSTLASPSRVFLSPFPPPNQEEGQDQQKKSSKDNSVTTQHKKHSICPYKISTDLARISDIYNKQSPPHTKLFPTPTAAFPPPPKRSTSLAKSCDDSFLFDKYVLSPISTFSSSGEDDDYEDDDDYDDYDVVSLYYYSRNIHDTEKDQDEHYSNSDNPSSMMEAHFSSSTLSPTSSSSSSLSVSSPSHVYMRASISTPLLKTRQSTPVASSSSSSTTTAARLPKWIKHVSQSPGLLEKKISRGFPFRLTVPVPLRMATFQDSPMATSTTMITTKALYRGSPLVGHYLNSVTKAKRFDDMLKFGFPCPNALHLSHHNDKLANDDNTTKNERDDDDNDSSTITLPNSKKPRCPATCHQCGGQQRLMTLRVTLTPLHARANENDIYKSNRKRSRKIRHTTEPMVTASPCPL